MAGHTHLKKLYNFEEISDVYHQPKNILHPTRFSWDITKIFQHCCLGTLGMPEYVHSKRYYQLVENFCVSLQAEIELHHNWFFGDIPKICKLFWGTLGMPGYIYP